MELLVKNVRLVFFEIASINLNIKSFQSFSIEFYLKTMTFSGESKISRLRARVTFLKSCPLCQQKANFFALRRSCLLWEQKNKFRMSLWAMFGKGHTFYENSKCLRLSRHIWLLAICIDFVLNASIFKKQF